jgi:YqaJ-like viral recombinase domain
MSDNPFDPAYVEPTVKPEKSGRGVEYHKAVTQGSLEWLQLRCGLLTASEMKHVITPTLAIANNEKKRGHVYELLSQRITQFVEEGYQSFDMMRGHADEIDARELYHQTYAQVEECGFVTNDKWGFKIGFSPDGLVGEDGLIECKSRVPKYQAQTIVECVANEKCHDDYVIQVQTALLVSERKWCDVISYCGGMPMATVRVYPSDEVQRAIVKAARAFEQQVADTRTIYDAMMASGARLIPTKRSTYQHGDLK